MFKWLIENEPVWLASAVMAICGFVIFVWTKYGLDSEVGTAFMALLPVLLAPLTRKATSSRATVEKVAAQAADTGNAALAVEAHK
jgi:hypothetical protein